MRSFEWSAASMVLALGWAACSSAANEGGTPVEHGKPGARAIVASAAVSSPPTSARATNAAAPAPKLTAAEAWKWLCAKLPEQTALLRLDESRTTIEKLLAWAPGEEATVVFDRACRPLALSRDEQALGGVVHEQASVVGRTKTVHRDGITFGFGITVVCGSDTTYERGAGGAWVESGVSATGCDRSIGHSVSDVRDGQVWYAAEPVALTVKCGSTREQEQRCTDGTTRTCTTCSGASLHVKRHARGPEEATVSSRLHNPPGAPVDCSTPCPPDELTPMVAAANAALSGAAFEQLGYEQHPTLFRDRAACTAYKQKHPIPRDQIDLW